MHQQYYDTNTSSINTWQQQAAPCARFPYGLGLDNDEYIIGFGIYPYREEKPDYDYETQKLVPDPDLVIIDNVVVLIYRPVSL